MANKTSWDLSWSDRPTEEARNLNPAFCGELISRAVSEYFRIRRQPFALALSFVVLPLALHKPTKRTASGECVGDICGVGC
jgi:hypothetical protein